MKTDRDESLALANEPVRTPPNLADATADTPPSESDLNQQAQLLALARGAESGKESNAGIAALSSELCEDPELIADFLMESREHLASVEQRLLELEQNPRKTDAIHATFRSFHTIKGLSGFLGFNAAQQISHETETLLDLARSGSLTVTPLFIDIVLRAADYLSQALNRIESGTPLEPSAPPALIREITQAGRELGPASSKGAEAPAREHSELPEKTSIAPVAPSAVSESQAREEHPETDGEKKPEGRENGEKAASASLKVDADKIEYLIDMVGEMVIAQSMVRQNATIADVKDPTLLRNLAQLSRVTTEVQKTAMSMRMAPVSALFQKMSRVVRDVARKSGKQVNMAVVGEDAEMDRKILDGLAEPLMHMVRNAVDHGLETPDQRIQAGKPPVGIIRLRAEREAGNIVIEIGDDGRGLNQEKIRSKAIERGLIKADSRLTPQETFRLIFEPGFSTAEQLTEFSGRGVGMDVVRRQVESLRGRVDIESVPGNGSTFTVRVPLTLATVDGLLVRVGGERYIIPTFVVKEIFRAGTRKVSTVASKAEVVEFRKLTIPVVRLAKRLKTRRKRAESSEEAMIVIQSGAKLVCLAADEVIGKYDVVIKSLGSVFRDQPGIAGGAILGDGRVGLILDIEDLLRQVQS